MSRLRIVICQTQSACFPSLLAANSSLSRGRRFSKLAWRCRRPQRGASSKAFSEAARTNWIAMNFVSFCSLFPSLPTPRPHSCRCSSVGGSDSGKPAYGTAQTVSNMRMNQLSGQASGAMGEVARTRQVSPFHAPASDPLSHPPSLFL